ncbi:MAG TPA: GlsB/YeaQ/YmgE family stress response membrane protein [Dongiaceae bacterium]|nr:GlsB/YeaQ/YmgE family stress response membrane protein [Dongiaceae bacterium]
MGILSWILFGLLAGIVAKFIMPGRDPGGFIVTILLGVVGAFVGGFIAAQFGFGDVMMFDLRSFIIAVAGAILVLVIYRAIRR